MDKILIQEKQFQEADHLHDVPERLPGAPHPHRAQEQDDRAEAARRPRQGVGGGGQEVRGEAALPSDH